MRHLGSARRGFSSLITTTILLTATVMMGSGLVTWSTTWGVLSINYTSLQWSQNSGTTWNSAWAVPGSKATVWRLTVTNNDPTRTFILNGNSTMLIQNAQSANSQAWWIISSNYPPLTAYSRNSQSISPSTTTTVYFGSNSAGGSNSQNTPSSNNQYAVSILLYGYWNSVSSSNFFGQNVPYEGLVTT